MAPDRLELARNVYRDALAAARVRSTPTTWARLVRAGQNVREALQGCAGVSCARPPPARAARSAPPLRVLVVEDDAATRDALRDILLEQRMDVRVAPDGAGALELLRTGPWSPSVIVIDAVLPDLSGAELHDRLRCDPRLRDIPLVIMSARRDARIPSLRFFEKPFDPTDLIAAVTQLSNGA